MLSFPAGLEHGYAARLLRRFRALRTLVLDRMGPAPTVPEGLDAVRRTQSVAAGAMAPEPRAFLGDARALEVAVTREVARSLKAPVESVTWQRPQVDALLSQWAATQAKLVARLEADVLQDIGERVGEASEGDDLRALVTARFAAHEARARLITRNELGNLQAALVQLRAKAMGAHRYRWLSRDDERVRPLHAALDGTVRSWDDPHPTEGHPGQAIGCRCVADPLRDDAVARTTARATVTATPPSAVLPPRPPAPKPTPKPVTIPTLPPLEVPAPAALQPLPAFTPGALPAFSAGKVSPIVAPVIAPPAPMPVLPTLQIPTFPKPPPAPRPPPPSSTSALVGRAYQQFRGNADAKPYGAQLISLRGDLTDKESGAIGSYSGGGFIEVNASLRTGRTHRNVQALDSAIAKGVLPDDIVVWRGIGPNHPIFSRPSLVKVGDVVQEDAYVSTSLAETSAFGGGALMRVRVPAGSPGLFMSDLSDHPEEMEVLLARGSRFQIVSATKTGYGRWVFDVILLPRGS